MRSRVELISALALFAACAPVNRLGLPIRVEMAPQFHAGFEPVHPEPVEGRTPRLLPVVVFLDGDGSQCQSFSESLWSRFVIRNTGHFVLVRPKTLINQTCETPKFAQLDFLHRLGELEALLTLVRQKFPGGPLVLAGHSAGAHVAMLYAAGHAEQIAGLVNISGGYDELAGVFEDLGKPELREFVATVASLAPEKPTWGRTARFWSQMIRSGVKPLWLGYDKPCLVLHGMEDDASVPFAGVQRDAREVKGRCALTPLPGTGHDTLGAETWTKIDAWLEESFHAAP